MKKMIFIVLSAYLLTGCASSNWALRKANDRTYLPYTYPNKVIKVAPMSDWLVIEYERTAEPEKFEKQYKSKQIVCFARNEDFQGSPITRVDGGQLESRSCLDNKNISPLKSFNEKTDLSAWFLLPSLETAVEFYPSTSARNSLCTECKKMKPLNSVVIEAYKFNTQLFYLKLKDGRWIRFTRNKKSRLRDYKPTFVKESDFLNEKQKPKKMSFKTIPDGYYLQISTPKTNEQVFYSKQQIIKNKFLVNKMILNRTAQDRVIEKGASVYYALLPFTIALDIVTAPIQWYMLMKANSKD